MSATPLSLSALRERAADSPFVAFMGLEPVALDQTAGSLSMRITLRPEFERSKDSGRWHGGLLSALADTVGDFVVMALTGHAPPTVNFRIDYLRPAATPTLLATAVLRRMGRSLAFVDVDLHDEQKQLVAIGRANYAMTGLLPVPPAAP